MSQPLSGKARALAQRDGNLATIVGEITALLPVNAIILSGSRATNQGVTPVSDYDLVVVLDNWRVPLYLKRLKGIESSLGTRLGVPIVVSPLPLFRFRRARGNLFLFKLKQEGIPLWGEDFFARLDPGSAAVIRPRWYFSLLFSGIKHLVEHFSPGDLRRPADGKEWHRDVAKAIVYCAQLLSLRRGSYPFHPEVLTAPPESFGRDFVTDLNFALKYSEITLPEAPDMAGLWLRTRDYLLATFRQLMSWFHPVSSRDLDVLTGAYLKHGEATFLRNGQYFAMTCLLRREIWWRSLFAGAPVENRIQIAALHLMLSVTADGDYDAASLVPARRLLQGRTKILRRDFPDDWQRLRETVCSYWAYACPVMGF